MLPKTEIEKNGGKAAILNHIRDNTDLPVPRYVVKQADQSLDSVLPEFNSMAKPVIVRSSSPYEYGDFEGIFESVRDVHSRMRLEQVVKRVEASATSERAKLYAKQNDFEVDEKMHVMVQEQSPSAYCGAMMRHPNNPDLVFINRFSSGEMFRDHECFLFDEKIQGKGEFLRGFHSFRISEDDAKFLVEQYRKVEALEDIAKGQALFVEFGFEPFAIYQARPFKKIETANFELPGFEYDREGSNHSFNFVFGITPPEGIVLPAVRSLGITEAEIVLYQLAKRKRDSCIFDGIAPQLNFSVKPKNLTTLFS